MLASSLRSALGPMLRECSVECGVVAITDVEVSRDLSVITVSLSALKDVDAAVAYFSLQKRRVNDALRDLRMRKMPIIRWKADSTSQRGARIDELLNSLSKDSPGESS